MNELYEGVPRIDKTTSQAGSYKFHRIHQYKALSTLRNDSFETPGIQDMARVYDTPGFGATASRGVTIVLHLTQCTFFERKRLCCRYVD